MYLFLVGILIHFSADSAFAQLFTGPVASGVGGAGVASVEVAESTFLNPATLAHAPTFVGGLFYQDGWSEGINHQTQLAVNLIDNSEGVIVPGSFAFVQERKNYPGLESVNAKKWNVSFGNFIVPQLAMGFSIHYLEMETPTKKFDQLNMTSGILWNPHPDWGFGIVYYNLFTPSEKTPLYFRDLKKITLGATFIASEFLHFRLDFSQLLQENLDKKLQIKGGMESFLSRYIVLRLGWRTDQLLERDSLTAGLSFIGPRFTLDYGYQKSQNADERGALHSVDMTLPF